MKKLSQAMVLEGIGGVFGWVWFIGIGLCVYFLVQWIRGVHPWWFFGIAVVATFLCKQLGTAYLRESSQVLREHDMENEERNVMGKHLKIKFKDIPVESKFAVFNKGSKKPPMTWSIEPGDSEIETMIPDDWESPYKNLRTLKYHIPSAYVPIDPSEDEIEYTGGDYYIDIDRDVLNEELNQKSIETLIHKIHGNETLEGRQQFFISLVSLQSYFEHLVYGMLVQSGHRSKNAFGGLQTHANRTREAFSINNTEFFSDQIEICPGKENLGSIIPQQTITDLENIFNKIRTLRNKVVHKWGYKDISQQEIKDIFLNVGEHIDLNDSADKFYKDATFVFIRLYAKASSLKNQLSLFHEKEMVGLERESRGYS